MLGLFCYSFFAIFYAIFDIDRLGMKLFTTIFSFSYLIYHVGHHGAMPVLSRFGRCFSAGFYAFLGVVAAQTTANIRDDSSVSSEVFTINILRMISITRSAFTYFTLTAWKGTV